MPEFSYSPVLGNRTLELVCSQMPNSTRAALSENPHLPQSTRIAALRSNKPFM